MYRWAGVAVACLLAGCAGKLEGMYEPFPDYAMVSPLSDTHSGGVPKDPLHPAGAAQVALPSTRLDQDPDCIVAFSMSGGGANSAAFAWGALEEINRQYPRPGGRSVLQEIDYLSTSSGGGIAALMLIEVLREHSLREHAPLTQTGAETYLASARFRGVLDQQLGRVDEVLFSVIPRWFGNTSTKVRARLRIGIEGSEPRCTEASGEAGPLAKVPRTTDAEFRRYVTCKLTDVLRFEDVFMPPDQRATLPVFLPAVTLFESGDLLPATSEWLKKLGVEQILFALPNSSWGDVVPIDELNYVDAVTMSMSFPGIGPLLAVASHGNARYGVTLADGGQTDNLGLWLGYAAVRNELRTQERRGAVHVVLDSAIEPATPFIEQKLEDWKSVTVDRVIANGSPLLRIARASAEGRLRLHKHADLGEKAKTYGTVFVRAQDVLDTPQMVYNPFWTLSKSNPCLRAGLPTDLDACLVGATPCPHCTPRARFRGVVSSLANSRQRAEDLRTLGQEAMARALSGELRTALDRCFSTPIPPAPAHLPGQHQEEISN